jgi:peroxiredoxin|tara:strand:- start:1289 stop:1552 length:264 start_codon:yes stop_codon:yes gene_type:complete
MASTDSLADNTAFANKNAASFPILADPGKEMTRDYGVLMAGSFAKRWTFYIDASGIIISIDKSVSARSAGADLVANLIRLQIPKRVE